MSDNEQVVYKNGEGGYIFISHSHHDIDKVRIIRNTLEENGYEPLCFFLKCLNDDDEVEGLIKREIDSRDIFLYVESPNSIQSEWVRKEREYINSCKNKTIFTIKLDEDTDVRKETLQILNRTRVFISYANCDRWAYELIKNKLVEKDLKVFDYNELKAGQNWFATIVETIKQVCQDGCFVVLLTEKANRSSHIRKELELAIRNGCTRILPILVGDVEIDETLNYLLSDCLHAKLSLNNNSQQIDDIANQIKMALQK